MKLPISLRLRLLCLVLLPLMLVAAVLGYWQYRVATATAEEVFDRALLSAALAISRDVTLSGGDVIQASTRELIINASGGEVFYHVTGPDGSYVTGYAYPPGRSSQDEASLDQFTYYEAVYRAQKVRVLSMYEQIHGDIVTGISSIKVWQRVSDRQSFASEQAWRSVAVIVTLLAALAVTLWIGVRIGLRPLDSLRNAIEQRNSNDLSEIRRPVPDEVRGIVATLNHLFRQLDKSMTAQQSFIANAAHQLRNPAAALLAMAESLTQARSPEDRQQRTTKLVIAARESARRTEQLLSLERLQSDDFSSTRETLDLNQLVEQVCQDFAPDILRAGIHFELDLYPETLRIQADRVLITEAIKNLLDNALVHGGEDLTDIRVRTNKQPASALITVWDNGKPFKPADEEEAFRRFSQLEQGSGSGLGLSIVRAAITRSDGTIHIDRVEQGASLTIKIPLSESL